MRAILALLLMASSVQAQAEAVVRLDSHGASATVIETGPGRSLLLSAAHPFQGADRGKPIVFTAPAPVSGQQSGTRPRLVKIDYQADLALVEVQAGPLPFVLPVSNQQPQAGQRCLSEGYDQMKWPAVVASATVLSSDARYTYTRENPVPGRSGGPLVCDGCLAGVVVGYETSGPRRGMFVALQRIHEFLGAPSVSRGLPAVREERFFGR